MKRFKPVRETYQPIPSKTCLVLNAALSQPSDYDVTILELKGLNCVFETCETGSLAEYGQLTETFASSALELIGDWVVERTKR